MKIGIIGATGHVGRFITNEALRRKHEVVGIVRNVPEETTPGLTYLQKDLFNLTSADIADFDVLVDSYNAPENEENLHVATMKHLVGILQDADTRLLVVGGAGSLYVDNKLQTKLYETDDFPADFKATAANMSAALDYLRNAKNVRWTYLSPSKDFLVNGARTGRYKVGQEQLLIGKYGKSEISMADYAIAMLDEIEEPEHQQQRFTVCAD
ncbi:NAD(P)-dependent oxidoreductase [Lapidilactobacillus achengensis]|uniref:NAD(P)-dependent oxidoreductase n=1 Tax=Lapidilactobacillus achengensis TaxID=2486000 RepID=A0ABW1UKW1_9LACO|nr:NAD(P)-dependent oxidoreductase [Lapidilactobacillus achengensis]